MRILALETATRACTVAVMAGGELVAEMTLEVPRAHGQRLLPLVERVLAEAGAAPADLDAIAVGTGPGSFTGLRIGLTVAKVLAMVLGKPVVGVGTLDVLAHGAARGAGLVAPLLDAGRGDVYAGLYRSDGCGGPPRRLKGPVLAPLGQWLAELAACAEPVCCVGEGAVQHRQSLAQGLAAVSFAPAGLMNPRAWAVAELGLAALQAGGGADPADLLPAYLRRTQAEVLWERRQSGSEGT